jgi:hypothetical protein
MTMILEQSYSPETLLTEIRYAYVSVLEFTTHGDWLDVEDAARDGLESVRLYQLCRAEGMDQPVVTDLEVLYAPSTRDADVLVADLAGSFWDALQRAQQIIASRIKDAQP